MPPGVLGGIAHETDCKAWTMTRSPVTWHLRSFFHWHRLSRRPGLPTQLEDACETPVLCTPIFQLCPRALGVFIEWSRAKHGGGSSGAIPVTHSKFEMT